MIARALHVTANNADVDYL